MGKRPSPAATRSQDTSEQTAECLYNILGDTAAALEACSTSSESPFSDEEYNRLLLSFLVSSSTDTSTESVAKQLNEWQNNPEGDKSIFSKRKRQRQDFVVAYNRSLIQYANGKPDEAVTPLLNLLRPFVVPKATVRDNLIEVSSNCAFLVLECILSLSEGRHDGLQQPDSEVTTDAIIAWLDSLDFETNPRLKFLLALYKSRLDFAARDASGKMIDSKVKNVRKELKLRPDLISTTTDASSLGSSSEANQNDDYSYKSQLIPGSHQEALLQSLNQSALNLKANFEQIKSNTKKSLVLCAEARSPDPVYESMHFNNLAVVYASCAKRHLALHSISRSLRICETPLLFRLDGTATPDSTLAILHNSALLAFSAQKFVSAYECMANCVMISKEYAKRPRCWLRMAESCIGVYNENKKKLEDRLNQTEFAIVEQNGEANGVLLKPRLESSPTFYPNDLVSVLGCQMDLEQVRAQPLGRAYTCLEQAISMNEENPTDIDCLESARCSLAYLKLELRDYQGASDLAISILLENNKAEWQQISGLRERVHKQRLACARLYASEAFSALGNLESARQLLSNDSDSGFLNELSVDFSGGVSPNIDVDDVNKLVQSTALVQSNASAVAASAGHRGEAEQLAMAALQSSDQDQESGALASDTAAIARKTLLFCMLQEGNREGALELLSSGSP